MSSLIGLGMDKAISFMKAEPVLAVLVGTVIFILIIYGKREFSEKINKNFDKWFWRRKNV